MSAADHFRAGRLSDAIAAAQAAIRAKPQDANARYLLAELLCFTGDFERADKQLDAVGDVDPKMMYAVTLFRHLIRGEQARQQFYTDGRVPEFLGQPSEDLKLRLQASIAVREKNFAEAARLYEQAEARRSPVQGQCNGKEFADLRDLDDQTASVFEVLSPSGKYFWVPFEAIRTLEFRPPERSRDLLWRSAHAESSDGQELDFYLPVLYTATARSENEQCRLGRMTDWIGGDGEPVRGIGQRTFLVGEESIGIMDLQTISITVAAEVANG